MQILASALPGFRDLRAPLIAGYLWLVFLWILIKPDLHERPTNEVAAAVYGIAKDTGPIWIALGIGVAAFLIGSVSQALSPLLNAGLSAAAAIAHAIVRRIWIHRYGRWQGPDGAMLPRGQLSLAVDQYVRAKAPERYLRLPWGKGELLGELHNRFQRGREGLRRELELPATVLLDKEADPQLFAEADRLKAERELRLAVVPALSAIAIFLGWNQSWWWWLALIAVAVLLLQAYFRNLAFMSLMLGAVQHGLARSQSLEELLGWFESLPPHTLTERRRRSLHRRISTPRWLTIAGRTPPKSSDASSI